MALDWKLREVLAETLGITSATALRELILLKARVELSLETVSKLLNGQPNALRTRTMQALCDSTGLKLSDFCDIGPDQSRPMLPPRPLYRKRKTAQQSAWDFPSPRKFVQGGPKH